MAGRFEGLSDIEWKLFEDIFPISPEKRGNKPMTYNEWLKMPEEERHLVKITASFGTGWQRRSTGNTYNSMSGHGFFIGAWTRKVLSKWIHSKGCSICFFTWVRDY
mgnify:CR=1 FL=1